MASPGRHFSALELKTILAHLVLNYDMKLEKEGVIPDPFRLGATIMPNPKAKVLFRKRQQ